MCSIEKLRPEEIGCFEELCWELPAFGAKMAASRRSYGLEDPEYSFWLCRCGSRPVRAMELHRGVLVAVGDAPMPQEPLALFILDKKIREVQSSFDQVCALRGYLGGTTDSSWFMYYTGKEAPAFSGRIEKAEDYPDYFRILQVCNPFYREHYTYPDWSEDAILRAERGETEFYVLRENDQVAATGSIGSMNGDFATVSSVSVLPECRHRGLGTQMTNYLVDRILKMGKVPCLIASSDAVCELYRRCGFVEIRRWGQLFLTERGGEQA